MSVSHKAVSTTSAAPLAANVLNGVLEVFATTAATTVITIPAGRTWVGTVGAAVAVGNAATNAAAGACSASITTAGTGVTPTAGQVMGVYSYCGATGATSVAGTNGSNRMSMPLVVVAPAGNTVTVRAAVTCTGASAFFAASVFASGQLVPV